MLHTMSIIEPPGAPGSIYLENDQNRVQTYRRCPIDASPTAGLCFPVHSRDYSMCIQC